MENISFNRNANKNSELTIVEVDRLADELVAQFNNPEYRRWYCKLIYKFGYQTVMDWKGRVSDANNPATLFSKIASQALKAKEARERLDGR